MSRTYRIVLPLLALWLIGWIVMSWAAIQDDALIHLRYADNLLRTHQVTYDGVHASYGASSLLYVHLLALLSAFTSSVNLPRAVSSCAHLLLFAGMALVLLRLIPARATLARLLGLMLLYILATPSSVRWLDDGMETGLGLCFTAALCWAASSRAVTSAPVYFAWTALAFFAVLLRPELALLCLIVSAMAVSANPRHWWRSSHVLLGCGLAFLLVFIKMHALFPDAALAKANRSWLEVLSSTVNILAGSMSFGLGLLLLWLLTLTFVCRARCRMPQVILANSVFPVVLLLATLKGQQVQGARYLVWAYFFSTLWNILELAQSDSRLQSSRAISIATALFVLLLAVLPFEASAMAHVLRARAHTLASFEADHLDVLHNQSGVAFDVGYIGYFSRANICDLAGLVNGRAAAMSNSHDRAIACINSHPDFLFLRPDQFFAMAPSLQMDRWAVCSHYDFVNLRRPDTHYLLLPSASAAETCEKISPGVKTQPAASLPH
jgi:hypothetical protein